MGREGIETLNSQNMAVAGDVISLVQCEVQEKFSPHIIVKNINNTLLIRH